MAALPKEDEYEGVRKQFGLLASVALAELRRERSPFRVRSSDLEVLCALLTTPAIRVRPRFEGLELPSDSLAAIKCAFERLTGLPL